MEPNDKAIDTARPTTESAPPAVFAAPTRDAAADRPQVPPAEAAVPPASAVVSAKKATAASAVKQKNNVRKIRIERMMSKAELARRANLSVLTIDRIEKGFGCRMDTKRKILEALGLSLDDRVRVFGEEE